ncbi:MAG: UvrB/UvrC protein [Firmicutes bacterium]|nr:UvrB/UvrC protein [Bacillota bacterium]
MLCDDCKERPASVHITKINNNQKTEKHLCEECAQKHGEIKFVTDTNFSVQDFLKGMFNYSSASVPQFQDETVCPSCGMTYSDFSCSGKVGCGDCYTAYGEQLEQLFRRIHGTSTHTGKVPKRSGGKLALKRRAQQLRQELDRCISSEEYEQAAKVRDEIKEIDKNLQD